MFFIPLLVSLLVLQAGDARTVAWKVETEGVSICSCDGRGLTFGDRNAPRTTRIYLVATMDRGAIRRLRIVDAACPIGDAKPLPGMTAEVSLDSLLDQLRIDGAPGEIVTAIALHAHPRVAKELLAIARGNGSRELRRSAIFWLGQKAGEKAAADLRAIVDEDPDDDIRERAVFAISQLPRERAVPMLIDLVRHHRRPVVRERAMFWLSQSGDERAIALIAEILGVP